MRYPNGLLVLTMAEFWDRFSFCGTLTILILYLTKVFLFSDTEAYAAWGAYNALSYIMPVLGGIVADRILGFERSITIGLLLMVIGNCFLGLSPLMGFYIGVAFTLCGIGLFKGNISSLVGMLYAPEDLRRESGYSLFFMGIVLGATLGPAVFGILTMYCGWSTCFLLSAFGNLFRLILFLSCRRKLIYQNVPKQSTILIKKMIGHLTVHHIFYLGLFLSIAIASLIFVYPVLSNAFLAIVSLTAIVVLTLIAFYGSKTDGKKIIGLTLLDLVLVGYYAASMQVNGSLVVGIERNFHIRFLGWEIPSAVFSSLEALFAFLLLPIFLRLWIYLTRRYFESSMLFKIGLGHLLAGISFSVFAWIFIAKIDPLVGLILANFLLGMSVVCVFPTHLSTVSQYAPTHVQGMLMGMSFLSSALSGYIGSMISELSKSSVQLMGDTFIYSHMYTNVAILMFAMCVFILLISSFLKSLFRDDPKEILANT